MKKSIILITIALASIIFFSACARSYKEADKLETTQIETVNGFEGIAMTIKDETPSPTGLTIVLENHSDKDFVYVPAIDLEVQIEDIWYKVPVLNEVIYDMALSWLMPGDETEIVFDWEDEYGKLGKGKYRAVLYEQSSEISDGSEVYRGPERLILAAEFKIT